MMPSDTINTVPYVQARTVLSTRYQRRIYFTTGRICAARSNTDYYTESSIAF